MGERRWGRGRRLTTNGEKHLTGSLDRASVYGSCCGSDVATLSAGDRGDPLPLSIRRAKANNSHRRFPVGVRRKPKTSRCGRYRQLQFSKSEIRAFATHSRPRIVDPTPQVVPSESAVRELSGEDGVHRRLSSLQSQVRGLPRTLTSSTVGRNTALQMANQAFTVLTSLLIFAMATRSLGTANYGTYALAATYAAFITVLIDGGLDIHLVKVLASTATASVSLPSTRRLVTDAVIARCTLWVASSVTALVFAYAIGHTSVVVLCVLTLSWNALLASIVLVIADVYQAAHDVRVGVLATFGSRLIAIIVTGLLFATNNLNIGTLIGASVLGGSVGLGLVALVSHRHGLKLPKPSLGRAWHLYRSSAGLAAFVILGQFVHRVDVVVLSVSSLPPSLGMNNQNAVGVYVAAYRLFDLSIAIPAFIAVSLAPKLAHFAVTDLEAFWSYLRRWLTRMAVAGASFALLLAVGGYYSLPILAGSEFSGSAPVILVLAVALPFAFITSVLFSAIVSLAAVRSAIVLYSLIAVGNLLANILLIPAWGYMASAWTTTVSQVAIAVGMKFILTLERRSLHGHP